MKAYRVPTLHGGPDEVRVELTLREAMELRRIGFHNIYKTVENDLSLALEEALIPERLAAADPVPPKADPVPPKADPVPPKAG